VEWFGLSYAAEMVQARSGRPRDAHLDDVILASTRTLLTAGSYAELSMESVASHAGVGKKTLYRRWPSKARLVAHAVLDAYGRRGSFEVRETGDLREDLRTWLVEHAEFIADPANAALIRALIAAAAANTHDNGALHELLSAPQHAGLIVRLQHATEDGEIVAGTNLDAMANALVGSLLLQALVGPRPGHSLTGLIDTLLDGALSTYRVP
jgi:AcrR family transcriptional regulator